MNAGNAVISVIKVEPRAGSGGSTPPAIENRWSAAPASWRPLIREDDDHWAVAWSAGAKRQSAAYRGAMTRNATPSRACSGDVRLGPDSRTYERPRRFPAAVRVLLAAIAMVLMAISPLIFVLVPGFVKTLNESGPVVGIVGSTFVSIVCLLTAVLLVWLLMRYVDRRPMRQTGWSWNSRALPMLLLGTVVAAVLVVVIGGVLDAAGLMRSMEPPDDLWWVTVAIALGQGFLMQGIPEELIWRGYVLQTLRTRAEVSILISAAGFAALHLVSQGGQQNALERVLYLATPFGFAMLAGALVMNTGSLWVACGIHGGFHVGTLISTFLGFGEGPAFWMTAGVAFTVIALVIMRRHAAGRTAAGRRADSS